MNVVDNLVASESRPQKIYKFDENFQMKMNLG